MYVKCDSCLRLRLLLQHANRIHLMSKFMRVQRECVIYGHECIEEVWEVGGLLGAVAGCLRIFKLL